MTKLLINALTGHLTIPKNRLWIESGVIQRYSLENAFTATNLHLAGLKMA